MVRSLHAGLFAAILLLCTGSIVSAASVGFILLNHTDPYTLLDQHQANQDPTGPFAAFTFEIYGDSNKPFMKFTNRSQSASITEFIVTIGDTAFNFDFAFKQNTGTSAGMTWKRVTPDADDMGGVRSDQVQYHNFQGFIPGRSFTFQTDIDPDNANKVEDLRKVLFNNGSAPNSVVTANFSNGVSLSYTLPDAPMYERYTFNVTIPLPPACFAGLALLIVIPLLRRPSFPARR